MNQCKFTVDYKNLDGLLILCNTAKLVTIDPSKGKWEITKKMADIINKEIEKTLGPDKDKVKTK